MRSERPVGIQSENPWWVFSRGNKEPWEGSQQSLTVQQPSASHHASSPGKSNMETGLRVTRKGRKLGSSRRRQTREPADGQDAPVAAEPDSWSSQASAELQGFFQDSGAQERGFVTREDLAVSPRPHPTPEPIFCSLLRLPIPGRWGLPALSPFFQTLISEKVRNLFILTCK